MTYARRAKAQIRTPNFTSTKVQSTTFGLETIGTDSWLLRLQVRTLLHSWRNSIGTSDQSLERCSNHRNARVPFEEPAPSTGTTTSPDSPQPAAMDIDQPCRSPDVGTRYRN
jgi:hypothetical protein